MENILMRVRLLKESSTISEDVFDKVMELINRFSEKGLISYSDSFAMMFVHISMALQREQTKENVMEMDDSVKEEIDNHEKISDSIKLWNENSDILQNLCEDEKYYILANFCNIL